MLISNLDNKIQILRISSIAKNNYLDSNRWERLISTYLPRRHTFDFEHFEHVLSTDDEYHLLINEFNSPFWIERKWFFSHQHYQYYNNTSWIFFYSIHSNKYNEICSLKKNWYRLYLSYFY
jgi:hypothetical protein